MGTRRRTNSPIMPAQGSSATALSCAWAASSYSSAPSVSGSPARHSATASAHTWSRSRLSSLRSAPRSSAVAWHRTIHQRRFPVASVKKSGALVVATNAQRRGWGVVLRSKGTR